MAAVTTYHGLGGLKQQIFIYSLRFGGWKYEVRCQQSHTPSEGASGQTFLTSAQPLVAHAVPWHSLSCCSL